MARTKIFSSKHDETLLRKLHTEVRILNIYEKSVAPPTKSVGSMATKTLEQEQQSTFQ